MWSKINELSRHSLSQMQIALKLGVNRDTVRRYQLMSEKEFEGIISNEVLRRKRKLEAFEGFIKQLLQGCTIPICYSRQRHNKPQLVKQIKSSRQKAQIIIIFAKNKQTICNPPS